MSEMIDLPAWVWRLIAGLERYEDEHPILYRMTTAGSYERTVCPSRLTNLIPREVKDAAELLARHGAVTAESVFADEEDEG